MFSWSSDKGTSIAEATVETHSAPEAPDTVHIRTESSENRPKPYSLETIKPADSTVALEDSTRTDFQSLGKDTTSGSPHSPSISQPELNNVHTTSVREEQLISPPSLSPLQQICPVPQTQEGISPPVAPNSATSIFAFNFPGFAKSRPLLETAPTPPQRDPPAEPSIATSGISVPVILLQILDFITAQIPEMRLW